MGPGGLGNIMLTKEGWGSGTQIPESVQQGYGGQDLVEMGDSLG